MARRAAERRSTALFLRQWLPVLLYVVVIFIVSAQPHLQAPFKFENADKLMHTLEYAGLGFLLSHAFSGVLGTSRPAVIGLSAICVGIMIGTFDELFQSTVPGRQCSPYDLMADTFGLVLGQFAFRSLRRLF